MRFFWLILSCSLLAAVAFVVWPAGGGSDPSPGSSTANVAGASNSGVAPGPKDPARTGYEPAAATADSLKVKPQPPAPAGLDAKSSSTAIQTPATDAAHSQPALQPAALANPSAHGAPLPNSGTEPATKAGDASAPTTSKDPNPPAASSEPPTGETKPSSTPSAASSSGSTAQGPEATKTDQPAIPSASAPAASANAPAGPFTTSPIELPPQSNFPPEKIVAAKAEKRSDGALLLDGRFLVKGAGTQADPYVVPWDLLVSAQETYKPRLGMTKLPQRVTMLDNKFVKIEGFIAFPITAASPREALVMLNQWDGCCIGTPPTPYDAIEVKLTLPASASQKLMTSGGITGRFRVDPYEDGGWLLGLFLMEDGKLFGNEGL